MPPQVAVIVAWQDRGDPYRRRSFEWTQSYWRALFPDAEHLVSSPEPFTRPKAINDAVRVSGADVFLQADPDSVVLPQQAGAALHAAHNGAGLVVAFNHWQYLTERASARLLSGEAVVGGDWAEVEEEGIDSGVGNVIAFSRRTWEAVGGFDERFDGVWGGDDGAFAYATGTLVAAIRRIDGPMYHLWHPRQPESEPGHPEYLRQFSMLGDYRDAAGNPELMRSLFRR